MGFVCPFVSILSQQQHRAEVRFYIWMLSSNNWVLFSCLIPQAGTINFIKHYIMIPFKIAKCFFWLLFVLLLVNQRSVKSLSLPGSLSVGCFSSLQFGCMRTDVLFSKASTHLLAWAAHALLSAGALPHWTFEPPEQIKSCSTTKWKIAFGLHEGSVPASAQLPGEAKPTEKHIVLDG